MKTISRIGRYEVERLLGQGGMGRVWLARDTVLGRRVAVKVLRDDLALPPRVEDELVVRMRHEAQAAAAVSHPSIVTLHDMGEDPTVGLYLVFEYVSRGKADEPESLRERLHGGSLPLSEVAKLARELGTALTFAHDAGIIHRDVKPENILFSPTGAKIADFGIARIPESTITRANTVLGTPAYTAPEALSRGTFGPESDQFALAATLYEAATCKRAFSGDDPIVTVGKVSSEPPPPLRDAFGESARVQGLENALLRGMAKDPAARFPSCAALGEAVARGIEMDATAALAAMPSMAAARSERTPLSSRQPFNERLRPSDAPGEMMTRPSIVIRRKTHRFQNILAAAAFLVIIGLVLFGRKSREEPATAASGSPTASPSIPANSSIPRHPRPLHPPPVERPTPPLDAGLDAD